MRAWHPDTWPLLLSRCVRSNYLPEPSCLKRCRLISPIHLGQMHRPSFLELAFKKLRCFAFISHHLPCLWTYHYRWQIMDVDAFEWSYFCFRCFPSFLTCRTTFFPFSALIGFPCFLCFFDFLSLTSVLFLGKSSLNILLLNYGNFSVKIFMILVDLCIKRIKLMWLLMPKCILINWECF